MENKNFVIAIDGPVGSGKGTLSMELAKELNALYLYTGGMYRALALACLRKKINIADEAEVMQVLGDISIDVRMSSYGAEIFLNGENVTEEIFLPEVGNVVPIVASVPSVRKEMVARQKELIKGKRAVVEGRDIATDVAPDAELKIYLTADVNVRARRRFEQFIKRGVKKEFEEVLNDTNERDRLDSERKTSPLRIVPEAYVIDTTGDTVADTLEKVKGKLKEKGLL